MPDTQKYVTQVPDTAEDYLSADYCIMAILNSLPFHHETNKFD